MIFELILKITPLYLFVLMGFIASKKLNLNKEGLANLSVYFLVPSVMFYGVTMADFSISLIFLPLIVFAVSCGACMISFRLCRRFLTERRQANIIALSAGTANSGYLGIPVAMMIFPANIAGLYITIVLGMLLFQNTMGIYILARSDYSPLKSIEKLLKLPIIYAFILGVTLNYFNFEIPVYLRDIFSHLKGAYVVVGMMIIGVGLASINSLKFDYAFTAFAMFSRFILWPMLVFVAYLLDSITFELFTADAVKCLILASIVPMPADSVAYATVFKCHPEETSLAVLASSIFAIIYMPIVIASVLLQ